MERGDYAPADLLHTLYTCPTSNAIIKYIQINLTNIKEISPVSVILTSNRCTKQVENKGGNHKTMNNTHSLIPPITTNRIYLIRQYTQTFAI